MGKLKIGIYVFTDQARSRTACKRNTYFDGQNYIGLRYIVKEIKQKVQNCEISYVSKDNVNSVDYALISLTSYYDEINLINELHGRKITAKLIVGGAGFNNVGLLRDIVDFGIVGRGENIVYKILLGDYEDGIYVKDKNYNLTTPLKIQTLREFITIEDKGIGTYKEQSVGCPRKCFFCEYSFKHKFCTRAKGYTSSVTNLETLLQDLVWPDNKGKDLISAVDGTTERTRMLINKPISNKDITNKMMEIYEASRDHYFLKLYCLVGYPFEDKFRPEELLDSILSARRDGTSHRLDVLICSPHFCPMPFTPLECEPVNFHNFRKDIEQYNFGEAMNGNIRVIWPVAIANSPIKAAEECVINRADVNECDTIKRILCQPKYMNLNFAQKVKVMEKYFWKYMGRVDSVLPYIFRNNDTENFKKLYYKNLKTYCL